MFRNKCINDAKKTPFRKIKGTNIILHKSCLLTGFSRLLKRVNIQKALVEPLKEKYPRIFYTLF